MEGLLKKTDSAEPEPKPGGGITEEVMDATEFLKQYQKAKFSDVNDKISSEDYKKVINYIDKCKNSLQYLKK